MELDNIKVEFYSALGKPKGSQTELENEIAGNGNDFIVGFPEFVLVWRPPKELILRNILLQEIVWEHKELYETCYKVWDLPQ